MSVAGAARPSAYARPPQTEQVPEGATSRRHRAADTRDEAQLAALMRSAGDTERTIVLENGTVVTGDPAIGNFVGNVLIRGTKILDVGPEVHAGADSIVVDASDSIVIPGLVDAHLHAWEGQLRGIAPAVDFPGYVSLTHEGFAPHYRPHDNYVGNLTTALVALDAGVTTIIDNSHNSRTPDHSNAAVEALRDAGIRAVHAAGAPQSGIWDQHWPQDILRLRDEYFATDDQLLTLRLFDAFPAPQVWAFAKEHDLWVSSEWGNYIPHLSELQQAGLLTPQHTFNHCFGLPDRDWDLIRDAGVTVNICARSDANFGLGPAFPPVRQALERGIVPGLSQDAEVSYGIDPFIEMQTLLTLSRSQVFDQIDSGADDPATPLTPEQIFSFATIGGALNANLTDKVGTLTPGKDADIVLLRTTDLNTGPGTNVFATLVGFATARNVDTVFVGGQVRKWAGRLVGHDLTALHDLVDESLAYLFDARGLVPDAFAERGYRERQSQDGFIGNVLADPVT
ncbi:amidohydrolase [Rhodococcus sp. ACS1]|uniref:amidohydrolase family protein n=1 Tax=Rhodococcus sp. ACS1 TaxID=2028570 RepID=UPI000BB11082|nr:amidohydrolase family protein [Rhodococcus sp. ACS1]PBC36802.1 amidohydrolase [Rhodococcus sp. ACS1]